MRAVLHLASFPMARIKEIAIAQYVPQEYLAKILQKLAKAGIVKTHRGVGGGISLGRVPEQITMLDVIEAVEGPVSLNRCFLNPGECPRQGYCAVHRELETIGTALGEMLAKVTFARLARSELAIIASNNKARLEESADGNNNGSGAEACE